jgi:pimeloyl-ACP methyl ester carboxylesterase/DNA-binding winged helix-turn-helix (wHTH) protein
MLGNGHARPIALPGFVFDPAPPDLRSSAGASLTLRPQTLAVLACLARRAGELVSKDELMRSVWPDVVVTDDSLVQCIAELRKALGDTTHRIIRTEPKRGYRLVAQAQPHDLAGSLALSDFKQDIHFATAPDGVRIAYALSGDGPPLVRAPHWMTHLDWDWRSSVLGPRIQAWSREFRLLRYDARGLGLSDRGVIAETLDQWVDDLETVVNAAGLERFALIGPSGGGMVAIRYAARHPRRVSHLLLIGATARGSRRRGEQSMSQADFDAMLRLIEYGWGQDNAAYRQISTSMLWPGASTEQMQSFNHLQRVSCEPRPAADQMRAMSQMDCTGDLSLVRCPTLVLHSPHDARVPFEEGRLIAASIPGARLEPFDSPNHTPLIGEPAFEQVGRLTEEFLLGTNNVDALNGQAALAAAPAQPSSA